MQQEQGTQDTFHSINTMPRKSRKPREPHHKDTTSQHFYYSKWLGTIDFEIHPPQNSKTASNTQSVSTEELSSPPPASDVALLPPPSSSEPGLQDQDSDGEDDCWIVDPSEPGALGSNAQCQFHVYSALVMTLACALALLPCCIGFTTWNSHTIFSVQRRRNAMIPVPPL